MKLKLFMLATGISVMLISCQSKTENNTSENLGPNTHKVIVEQVLQTSAYTYLKVKEQDDEHWLAVSRRQVKKDDILYYDSFLEMKNFESKELQQTFETIYFIGEISDKPTLESNKQTISSPQGEIGNVQNDKISISPIKGGVTIAELFSKRDKYSDKVVIIKGKVVKYSSQIMGNNWVHLQDGTNDGENNDLTITTKDVVKVGDIVIFKGKIALNKNIGSGYSFDIIMEEAKLESN